jgi:osmotically inducible protein OsmC
MPIRTSEAVWEGDLEDGKGSLKLGSGVYEGPFSFSSRFAHGNAAETNPEEFLAAAHAACFSMALSHVLAEAGHTANRIHTAARVHFEFAVGGFTIPKIELDAQAEVPEVDGGAFQEYAQTAKQRCPVSLALAGTEITLNAKLRPAEQGS